MNRDFSHVGNSEDPYHQHMGNITRGRSDRMHLQAVFMGWGVGEG